MKLIENMTKDELIEAYIEREKELVSKIESNYKANQNWVIEKDNLNEKLNKANAKLKKANDKIKKLEEEIEVRKSELREKDELIRLFTNAKYSSQRKRVSDFMQGPTLFSLLAESGEEIPEEFRDLISDDNNQNDDDECIEVKSYKRKKQNKNGKKQNHINYDDLEVEVINTPVPEGYDICDICGNKMAVKKYKERKELYFQPAILKMRIYRTPVFECVECQSLNEEGKSTYKAVEAPKPLFKGSMASPSLVSHIMDMKFLKGLPLYAQEKGLLDYGLILPRQNMVNWLDKAAKLLTPVYEMMKKDLLSKDVIQSDETTTKTLRDETSKNGYMWVMRTCKYDEPIVLYHYAPSRSKEVIVNFIKGYEGYIVSDAYQAYGSIEGTINSLCHVHAHRYVKEALEVIPKGIDKNKSPEYKSHSYYQKVFNVNKKIEAEALKKYKNDKEKMYEYIKDERNKRVKPIYVKFLSCLKEQINQIDILSKPTYLKAVKYILNHEQGLMEVFNYGKLPLDNNASERAIRIFAVNRHRCRFYVSPNGANGAAIIYSILLSAQENGLSGYMYMTYLLEKLTNLDVNNKEELAKLMPYSKELPDYIRKLSKKEIQEILHKPEPKSKY